MQLCNMAEIEKEEVEFPVCATLWQGGIYIRWQYLIFLFIYIVQLYKEDWEILRMLGCRAVALPSTEQIVCSSVQSCNYLYKYVFKGLDMASVGVEAHGKHDEIKKFVNSRFITASECMWRFFSFDVHGRDPSVQCLAVHENNQHSVILHEDKPQEALRKTQTTTLLGWFELNKHDEEAQKLKYHEIPEHCVWNNTRKQWFQWKEGGTIG